MRSNSQNGGCLVLSLAPNLIIFLIGVFCSLLVKMVESVNGGRSDSNASKRSSQNGYHSSNSGNAPKYKARKVSAIRDFPDKCGPNFQHGESQPKENVAVSVGYNVTLKLDCNGVQTENGLQNQPCIGTRSSVGEETDGVGTSSGLELQERVVLPPCEIVGKFPETNGVQSEMDIEIPALEVRGNHVMMKTDTSGKLINFEDREDVLIGDSAAVAPEPTDFKIETDIEVQSHELVESPVGEEGNESVDMLVERVVKDVIHNVDEGLNQMISAVKCMETESVKDHERKNVEIELPKEGNWKEGRPSAKQLGHGEVVSLGKSMDDEGVKPSTEVGRLIHGEVSTRDGSVPSPKNKFRRRRISATRDFPLHCGMTGSALPMEEHIKISSGETLHGVNQVNEEKGMDALKATADSTPLIEILTAEVENCSSEKLRNGVEVGDLVVSVTSGHVAERGDAQVQGSQEIGAVTPQKNTHDTVMAEDNEKDQVCSSGEMVLYGHDNSINRRDWDNDFGSGQEDDHVVVNALMAAKNCPWRQDKLTAISGDLTIEVNDNKVKTTWRGKSKAVAKKTIVNTDFQRSSLKKKAVSARKHSVDTLGAKVLRDEEKPSLDNEVLHKDFNVGPFVDVSLPPFGPSSSNGDARNRVRETLRLFQALCRKLLQGEESRPEEDTKSKQPEKIRRIDIEASNIMKKKGKEVNTGKRFLGPVPGVEVGDEFQYRVELAIVGLHRLYQAGIDYMDVKGKKIATSIVASGGYDDDMEDSNVLIYSGQGGFKVGKDKQPKDQKLERGNLALWNSKSTKNPIRVIRGSKEKDSDPKDSKAKVVTKYVYDGLYTVENHWRETGNHGKLVYMFELRRILGQPELAWKEVKKSKKARVRHGVCVDDIAGGKELFPICAVNTIDNEKPQPFNYIKKIMYPNSLRLLPSKGCDCIGRCSDSRKCSCALRNGGEIPYNRNGAIVEAKPLVYECGPHCKCPPSCYNRVSQHGIKIHLEIFKTKSRGWGVRSLSSISSGSFICEYVGEILEDKEAEKRTGSDEYLFDIGQNYTDCSVNSNGQENSSEGGEEGGYTIDAAQFGNVGRFINHSCSPNLYAQNVLYDHDDKRVPHIMLFAAENIPPLQELTYHYNYVEGQVHDSKGNIKVKSCYCGAADCTGRMY